MIELDDGLEADAAERKTDAASYSRAYVDAFFACFVGRPDVTVAVAPDTKISTEGK